MERLLAAATALLAVTAANAADLPKMFLGNWENMTITQRGYIGPGEDCRFNSYCSSNTRPRNLSRRNLRSGR